MLRKDVGVSMPMETDDSLHKYIQSNHGEWYSLNKQSSDTKKNRPKLFCICICIVNCIQIVLFRVRISAKLYFQQNLNNERRFYFYFAFSMGINECQTLETKHTDLRFDLSVSFFLSKNINK